MVQSKRVRKARSRVAAAAPKEADRPFEKDLDFKATLSRFVVALCWFIPPLLIFGIPMMMASSQDSLADAIAAIKQAQGTGGRPWLRWARHAVWKALTSTAVSLVMCYQLCQVQVCVDRHRLVLLLVLCCCTNVVRATTLALYPHPPQAWFAWPPCVCMVDAFHQSMKVSQRLWRNVTHRMLLASSTPCGFIGVCVAVCKADEEARRTSRCRLTLPEMLWCDCALQVRWSRIPRANGMCYCVLPRLWSKLVELGACPKAAC